MQQPLDPAGDHLRQRCSGRAVAHQAVGVEVDPGIAEDAAERLCWVDLDALHDQVQIVGAQIPERVGNGVPKAEDLPRRGRQIDGWCGSMQVL